MDSNSRSNKRSGGGGFIKGKLSRSLYRASSIKVKPSRSPRPAATDHVGYMTTMLNQLQKSNVNIITTTTGGVGPCHAAGMDALYGGLQVDETVDLKAANYISSVLERFRLEHLN